jgi:hypothetical protein
LLGRGSEWVYSRDTGWGNSREGGGGATARAPASCASRTADLDMRSARMPASSSISALVWRGGVRCFSQTTGRLALTARDSCS